jgi:plasmid stabilization system protein ParE
MGTILEGLRLIELFPEGGRPAGRYEPGCREWLVSFGTGAYIVLYRHLNDRLDILAIRHSREAKYEP